MIVFIPSPSALELSAALWDLARPPAVRETGDTSALFDSLIDTQGVRHLVVDTTFEMPIHQQADAAPVAAILQPYETAGHLPNGTVAALVAAIEAAKNTTVVVYDLFPAYFKSLALDFDGMIQSGKIDPRESFAMRIAR